MLRIDEFSSVSDWGGALSSEEQVQFSTFGFNVSLTEYSTYFEQVYISSPIHLNVTMSSKVFIETFLDSRVTLVFPFNSFLEA